ncbi:GIY-YIG nuclease family protein [Streptomyces sp. NBC_01788]|uniref:GIY-YIG nuclease family protein n=1 Tax=Streptomyces sp. NBC_01788 TaxID=2975940 RepID=UPI002DDB6A45|nr:GIY-YIG nuclease family protein [Streptomyces sp. NBC_01788]WSB30929.1 GIY-YIG nuclease family protein [Streptomyces sp. NBC_01788]
MRGARFSVDFSFNDHWLREVSLTVTVAHRRGRATQAEPEPHTEIDVLAVMDMLDLIDRGAVSAAEVRGVLEEAVGELREEFERGEELSDQDTGGLRQRDATAGQEHCDDRLVYAVSSQADPKAVKIGVSKDVLARRKTLQSGSGSLLVVRWTSSGGGWLEERLHERFAARALGGEWFDFRDVADPVQMIERAARKLLRQSGAAGPGLVGRQPSFPRHDGAGTSAARRPGLAAQRVRTGTDRVRSDSF